jgi:hypothetical protein
MKNIALLFGISLCLAPAATLAEDTILGAGMNGPAAHQVKPVCVQADRFDDYNARPVGMHEVVIRNALGSDHRGLKLFTTCTYIDPTARISVHAFSKCVSMGDEVSAIALGGHHELCRVARVEPFVEGSVKPPYK